MVIKEDRCAKIAQHLLPDPTGVQLSCVASSGASDCASTNSEDSEELERGNWVGKLDFFLSCVGYAVGLGNIWRFPYLCYRSGGGAFLLPYLIFLVLCGMPMFMLELCFGQFASLGPITIWRISPLFRGIGYAMVAASVLVCIYYNVIITWTIYYMYLSVQATLPWAMCNNWWNTNTCVDDSSHSNSSLHPSVDSWNNTIPANESLSLINQTDVLNSTFANETAIHKGSTPSEEFWKYYVLRISPGIEDLEGLRPELLLCLFIAWVVVFLCLCKGVKSSGRVVYVSATFPYLVLVILLVRGLTLPGAMKGIEYYLIPRWDQLKSFKVWGDAATQIFYSVGTAWGSIITMASYNRFNHNALRDAMLVPVINCSTSIFAGLVVFSIIGFMAHSTNTAVDDVVSHGPGLAFIVYPGAVTRMPFSPLWAFLFFAMVFTIGLDSQFGMFECVISSISDEFPVLRRYKISFTAFACCIMFLLGIPCVTNGGMYILTLMDWYTATFPIMVICLMEALVISWVYGVDRFIEDICLMVGRKPSMYYRLCWKYITPSAIIVLIFFNFYNHQSATYNDYDYPPWAIFIGWMMAWVSMGAIPLTALILLLRRRGSFIQRLQYWMRPTPEWGPAKEEHRILYKRSLCNVPSKFLQTHVAGLSNLSEASTGICEVTQTGVRGDNCV